MIRPSDPDHEEKLPFPTRPLRLGNEVVEEYIIPADRKQEVLEQLYLFTPVPSLDDEVFDIHEGKKFIVRDFRVTWENGRNWLVSPYYPSSGGTVIDWMPADWEDEEEEDEEDEEDFEDDFDEDDEEDEEEEDDGDEEGGDEDEDEPEVPW